MHTWQLEFSNSYPCIRVRFTVQANTYEEALALASRAINGLRMSACYKISGYAKKEGDK